MSIRIDYAPMNNAPTTTETCTMNKIEPFKEYVGYISEWDGSEHVTDEQIVRCRDCRHFTSKGTHKFENGKTNADYCKYVRGWLLQITPNGYCKWGERRQP